jgi:ubiquinone/menaquinone biosynthesis C-methylase UbiE
VDKWLPVEAEQPARIDTIFDFECMNTTAIHTTVNRAFSKQAAHYDELDFINPVLRRWRQQVYDHVNRHIPPGSKILELNAGTGTDALYFVHHGHTVHATDLSDGMIEKIKQKIDRYQLHHRLTCLPCAFEHLDRITERGFDYIFSNFGGLNCVDDLTQVTHHFRALLKPGGFVTLVIMPPVSLWEWLWIFKGHGRKAFRRFEKTGADAQVEGEYFKAWYHSASTIKKAMGNAFALIDQEGLGIFTPPPSKPDFEKKFPRIHKVMTWLEAGLRHRFPLHNWGDHIIITFQLPA